MLPIKDVYLLFLSIQAESCPIDVPRCSGHEKDGRRSSSSKAC